MIAIYFMVFALGYFADILTVEWHRAREAMEITRAAILSMALEALTWIPVVLFVLADDPIVALVSILAAGAGTRTGLLRIARQNRDPVILPSRPDMLTGPPPIKHPPRCQCPPAKARAVIGFGARVNEPQPGTAPPRDSDPVLKGIHTQE